MTLELAADDIPVAHTPAGGYGPNFPPLILAGCNEPLVAGAPDLRGTWKVVRAQRGGLQRVGKIESGGLGAYMMSGLSVPVGYVAPLPGLGAYVHGDSGDIYYFLTEDGSIGGAVRIVGVFAANGTLASSGTIPGDASQAPSSLFYL